MARTHSTKHEAPDFTLHIADHSWDRQQILIAILADVKRELQKLNATLGCYRVRRGMDALHRIDRRLAPRRPLKPGRKKA